MKKIFFFAAAAAMMAACSENDQLALNQEIQSQQDKGIQFGVYTNRAVTRAGQAGVINTDSLKKGNGIGVFAYHTNNSRYDERNSLPNFMYNQQVKWNAAVGNGVWEYSPLKYWPNEFGTNAVSEDIDYVTFFAYAPYVAVNPTTGTPEVDYSKFVAKDFAQYLGYDDVADFEEKEGYKTGDGEGALKMLFANQQQGKNINSISRNADKGDPIVRYVVDTNPQTSVDLLWGVAAKDNAFKGLAGPDNVTEGNCYLDLSKQIGTADSIRWNFHHALAKLNVQIIAAADTATQGLTTYEPKNAEDLETATKIYLRSIDFTGFATRGALNLHSEATAVDYMLKPNWTNYDGTDLTAANVTFYDGLKDLKEGYTDNIAPNEKPQGLNPVLIEEPTTTTWAKKRPGIPTKAYANLFAGAKTASDAIFVIPTNERMTITVIYDVMTRDTLLSQNLSDGFTKGSRVQNKISQTLQDLKLEAGKAYTIKLVVGIESVKVTVEVAEWDDTEAEQKVDLPYNPLGEGEEVPYVGTPLEAGSSYGFTNTATTEAGTTGNLYAKDGQTGLFYDAKTDADLASEPIAYETIPEGAHEFAQGTSTQEIINWATENPGAKYVLKDENGKYNLYVAGNTVDQDSPQSYYYTYEYVIPAGTKTGDKNVTLQYVKTTWQYDNNKLVVVGEPETIADKAITVNFDK